MGYNYRLTNIQTAIGLAQFEKINEFIKRRIKNANLYNKFLRDVEGITLSVEKEWAKNVYGMYSVLIKDEFGMSRDELKRELEKKGIETRSFFIPMHRQPVFQNIGLFKGESYHVAEDISRKGIYLTSGPGLKGEEIEFICHVIKKIKNA